MRFLESLLEDIKQYLLNTYNVLDTVVEQKRTVIDILYSVLKNADKELK